MAKAVRNFVAAISSMALVSCSEPEIDCITHEEFLEKWWVVTEPLGLDDTCYLFAEDGYVVTKDALGNNTIAGTWYTDDTACITKITSDETSVHIIGNTGNGCINANYDNTSIIICECPEASE
jgi:hypothetical protein